MRRNLAVFSLICAVLLTGIGHRKPSGPPATPAPTPTPFAVPTAAVPVMMIYPFAVNGDADKKAGDKMAGLFLAQIAGAGGVIVKPIPAKVVARTDYLSDAIKNGADYYLSGYMTPVGEEVALVEQLVSTGSGAIIWSSTAQVLTYGDALNQADIVRQSVINHAGRVEAQYRQQQALATPTPGPANGAQTSIGAILGLIKHVAGGRKAEPAPTLAPEKKPLKAILVIGHDGGASSLQHSLDRIYRVSNAGIESGDVVADTRKVCSKFPNITVASGETKRERTRGFPPSSINVFTLRMYNCQGTVFFTNTARSGSLQDAVDQAVAAYVSAHPSNS
ncbi:MAG: hypothetical protein GIW97_03290 [Candidatus Eremiobacteraeota bacterium]|nr:hypothetical protein [Candidatus Eremiobacteraeota bacterium]